MGRLFPFIAILHDANDLTDETEQSKYFDECHSNHSLPGAWIRPARRPKEMATADSPKDGEPPTVCGMPSEFQYHISVEACQSCARTAYRIPPAGGIFCANTGKI